MRSARGHARSSRRKLFQAIAPQVFEKRQGSGPVNSNAQGQARGWGLDEDASGKAGRKLEEAAHTEWQKPLDPAGVPAAGRGRKEESVPGKDEQRAWILQYMEQGSSDDGGGGTDEVWLPMKPAPQFALRQPGHYAQHWSAGRAGAVAMNSQLFARFEGLLERYR